MSTVLPLYLARINQPQVSLVDESRGLQCVSRAFVAQVAPRDEPQLGIDEWNQSLERCLIAIAPGKQNPGNFV
jgi:hypothetical protein